MIEGKILFQENKRLDLGGKVQLILDRSRERHFRKGIANSIVIRLLRGGDLCLCSFEWGWILSFWCAFPQLLVGRWVPPYWLWFKLSSVIMVGLCFCLARFLAYGVQHCRLLVTEWMWVLVMRKKSLWDFLLLILCGAVRAPVDQCPEVGFPTSDAEHWLLLQHLESFILKAQNNWEKYEKEKKSEDKINQNKVKSSKMKFLK